MSTMLIISVHLRANFCVKWAICPQDLQPLTFAPRSTAHCGTGYQTQGLASLPDHSPGQSGQLQSGPTAWLATVQSGHQAEDEGHVWEEGRED